MWKLYVPFRKISTPVNQVKLRYFFQVIIYYHYHYHFHYHIIINSFSCFFFQKFLECSRIFNAVFNFQFLMRCHIYDLYAH